MSREIDPLWRAYIRWLLDRDPEFAARLIKRWGWAGDTE